MSSFATAITAFFFAQGAWAANIAGSSAQPERVAPQTAIVMFDQTALRAAPRDSAQQQAALWQGELVEVRGERMDYVQIWDHRRERGGYIRATQVRRLSQQPNDAAELMSVVRFLRDTNGKEALGISLVAAYLQAAPAVVINSEAGTEAFDALGTFADRLAYRASSGTLPSKSVEASVAGHLEVAAQYGLKFSSFERDGRMQVCYDGEALRRVLALPNARQEQKARAALALTRPECVDPNLRPLEANRLDEWRADVLDRVDVAGLPAYQRNRIHMRRASVWSGLAYQRARLGGNAELAGRRALSELASVSKHELPDADQLAYNDAAMRVNASRWAAETMIAEASEPAKNALPYVLTQAGEPGETCVLLVDGKHGVKEPLAKRCTYGLVWGNSFSRNREGNAVALAVQPLGSWRELWVFRKDGKEWKIAVLPPSTTNPDTGYIEFAGWVPGGKQMLVAREARGEGKYKRNFEVLRLDSLTPERQASDPAILGAFQRWQDPTWKRMSVSMR